MDQTTVNLYITHLEKEGPFLKVFGQTEKHNSIYVEQFLLGASPQFEAGIGKVQTESLHVGFLICAKYKDNKYYRARVTDNAFLNEGFVEVHFLDYGNKDMVPCSNIRSLQNFPSSFISIPPLAIGFVFAEAHCVGGGEWNDTIFEVISKEIKYQEVRCTIVGQAAQFYLVKLNADGTDIATSFIQRRFMQPISLTAQQAVILSMSLQKNNVATTPLPPSSSPGLNTYKACTLEPGCLYPVYVSYVNDGPCHFSVQLKQSEEVLSILMSEVNSITLRPLEDIPIPGTICLARCQEDGNICRAVVTNEVDNQFKVFYVDFGNYEIVPLDALYQIPFKYVIPKVMAIRFALAGIEKPSVTMEMQCAFKTFVDNRLLHMKVLPTPTRMAIPKCELWDSETKTNALEVINRAAQHAYPEPISLNRGFSQLVKVSFVYSCNRFYVQLVGKESELVKLMGDLQEICLNNDVMDPDSIKIGLPCCALFESEWYRCEIVEILGDNVKVRYIDYGNEEDVPNTQLKIIDGEQLTVLRPQAIECCLNGYQNMEVDLERDRLLEEIILEGNFHMKVVEMLEKKALVELIDTSNYNVASLLLDKLAAATSQISPVLAVQAGNKIEHRKSSVPPQQQERRPPRDNTNWNSNSNERNIRSEKPWREENKDFRNHERNSNETENDGSSWRDNNKGFSPKHKKYDSRERSYDGEDKWNSAKSPEGNAWNQDNANDNWNGTQQHATQQRYDNRENNYGRNKNRYDNDRDGNAGNFKDGRYKNRQDNNRLDGSEVSSSGSEKSFKKGPRTSSRNERGDSQGRFNKPFERPARNAYNSNNPGEDSWNVSTVASPHNLAPVQNPAPATAAFKTYDVVGSETRIQISWFHNPGHFYCQLLDFLESFKAMMEEIQQFYKSKKSETCVVGAPIIGLFPEDNVLYRAQVLQVVGNQYKVYYVDFGNVSTISKVWPIDKKFMELPAQAIACCMNNLKPAGDNWLDADSFSNYFDKDGFKCSFINKDEEKTYVNIFYENEDIAQLLVRDKLAVSTQPALRRVDIPLLLGQQFRAVVKSVNNLSDIIIALECGLALSCTIHNLTMAMETYEDVLRDLLEQTVIVFVDNIIDNKLEVTIYDLDGNKYTIINPDECEYETIESLCPLLITSSTLVGYVSHVSDPFIYIQPEECSDSISHLNDEMFKHYDGKSLDSSIIPEEEQIYAVHSTDGNWYRGKVLSFNDETSNICYLDFGNTEEVEFKALRELEPQFKNMSIMCIPVFVGSSMEHLIDTMVTLNIFYGDNGWEGTVIQAEESAPTAGESYAAEEDTGIVLSSDPTNNEMEDENVILEPEIEDSVIGQDGTEVFVSHIDTPDDFYVQLSSAVFDIENLQTALQSEIDQMPVLENPAAGSLCAAPYTVDGTWYRAEILDADDDITTVRFIDFGNTDVIDNKTTQVKTLPPNLLSLAVYATRCSMNITSPDEEWSSNAMDRFEKLTSADKVTAVFLDQDERANYVDIYSDGQNVKEILIQEHLAVPVTQTTESRSTGFVSHLNSPSEFWMQLENCVDELEWIAEQLSTAESFPELEDLTPGTLCAALFPDDEMWYRARILSNTVAGIELVFIDYGNSCTSGSLRQLPEELVVTKPLAQKCSLQKPDGISSWTPSMCQKFEEISADGQTIFTVRKLGTGETAVVQLVLDGKDVAEMLLPTAEDCLLRQIESLDSLQIEINGQVLSDRYSLKNLSGTTWTEESRKKLEELNQEGTVFQIEFLSDNTIQLYLDGNDISPKLAPGIDHVATAENPKSNTVDQHIDNDDSRLSGNACTDIQNEDVLDVDVDEVSRQFPSTTLGLDEVMETNDESEIVDVSKVQIEEQPFVELSGQSTSTTLDLDEAKETNDESEIVNVSKVQIEEQTFGELSGHSTSTTLDLDEAKETNDESEIVDVSKPQIDELSGQSISAAVNLDGIRETNDEAKILAVQIEEQAIDDDLGQLSSTTLGLDEAKETNDESEIVDVSKAQIVEQTFGELSGQSTSTTLDLDEAKETNDESEIVDVSSAQIEEQTFGELSGQSTSTTLDLDEAKETNDKSEIVDVSKPQLDELAAQPISAAANLGGIKESNVETKIGGVQIDDLGQVSPKALHLDESEKSNDEPEIANILKAQIDEQTIDQYTEQFSSTTLDKVKEINGEYKIVDISKPQIEKLNLDEIKETNVESEEHSGKLSPTTIDLVDAKETGDESRTTGEVDEALSKNVGPSEANETENESDVINEQDSKLNAECLEEVETDVNKKIEETNNEISKLNLGLDEEQKVKVNETNDEHSKLNVDFNEASEGSEIKQPKDSQQEHNSSKVVKEPVLDKSEEVKSENDSLNVSGSEESYKTELLTLK